jgi:transposase-like protein
MTQAIARDPIYRRRRFQSELIELCVRWYLTYRLSYRDLVEMMAERGVSVSHSTILRWVQRYVPEFEKRWNRYARRVHSSWRMDETAVDSAPAAGRRRGNGAALINVGAHRAGLCVLTGVPSLHRW